MAGGPFLQIVTDPYCDTLDGVWEAVHLLALVQALDRGDNWPSLVPTRIGTVV